MSRKFGSRNESESSRFSSRNENESIRLDVSKENVLIAARHANLLDSLLDSIRFVFRRGVFQWLLPGVHLLPL